MVLADMEYTVAEIRAIYVHQRMELTKGTCVTYAMPFRPSELAASSVHYKNHTTFASIKYYTG